MDNRELNKKTKTALNIINIVANDEGKRLDIYISQAFSITRTKAKMLIEENYITVDGKTTKPSIKVKRGMHIKGEIPEEEPLSIEPKIYH